MTCKQKNVTQYTKSAEPSCVFYIDGNYIVLEVRF